jgi:shikimate kinase
MKTDYKANIILMGFLGTAKSPAAREIAQRLDWNFVDTDDGIVKEVGKPIAEIFR